MLSCFCIHTHIDIYTYICIKSKCINCSLYKWEYKQLLFHLNSEEKHPLRIKSSSTHILMFENLDVSEQSVPPQLLPSWLLCPRWALFLDPGLISLGAGLLPCHSAAGWSRSRSSGACWEWGLGEGAGGQVIEVIGVGGLKTERFLMKVKSYLRRAYHANANRSPPGQN